MARKNRRPNRRAFFKDPMNEPFMLPLTYQGEDLELKARFERWGYSHRIAVMIGEDTVVFEPDEEGGYRALSNTKGPTAAADWEVVAAVAAVLVNLKLT
jgi:hypothetical protein